jgi:hypothetical protein
MTATYRPLDLAAVRAAMPRLIARGQATATGCLLWQGYVTWNGYGQANIGGQTLYVHRAAWVAANERDPGPLQIDHLCRMRACFNPEHLEAVTAALNVQRTHGDTCRRGHPRDEANTYMNKGNRYCRPCAAIRSRNRSPRVR